MRDFEKVDWKKYNRPPFYQQWMCKDDTFNLATFGDRGLAEFDCQILKLKDQWDLNNVNGHFLDRIGKFLSEKRNGNPDEVYRVMLNLRRLLNTNDGSIPAIIKAIKYFYSSEVVHIVPDYPAGLIIEHDGEGTPGLNFNRLLTEIIPAGVSFSTKELFFFTEEFFITDALVIIVKKQISDNFKNGLKYNGRGKYDGHTLNPTEVIKLKYNGQFKYNGMIKYARRQRVDADSYVIVPFKYRSGIRDELTVNTPQKFIDNARSQLKYNGLSKYNGENKYSGFFSENSITDILHDTAKTILTDNETTAENLAVQIDKPLDEHFTTRNKYDGYFTYSGETKYHAAKEKISIEGENSAATETVVMDDTFSVGIRFRRKYDGTYKYNGVILYNGNVLIPM